MKLNAAQLESQFIEILVDQLGQPSSAIIPFTRFLDDLKCDSLDGIEIVMTAEEQFDIQIPDGDTDHIKNVGDALTYLHKRMHITEVVSSKRELARKAILNPVFNRVVLRSNWHSQGTTLVDGTGKSIMVPAEIGLTFNWGADGVGFGEFTIRAMGDGQIQLQTETMGKDFVQAALTYWLANAKVVE